MNVGSNYSNSSNAGLFYWNGNNDPGNTNANIGEHAVLIYSRILIYIRAVPLGKNCGRDGISVGF